MPRTKILDKELHLLKEIFEKSLAPMVITDAELELPGPQFVYVNSAFEQMTGYNKEDLKGCTPRILQGEKSDKAMLKQLKETLSEGGFFTGQTVNYRKDGSTYNVEWTISPIKNEEGKVEYFFSIQKDITAQILVKEQEQELFFQQTKMAAIGEMIDAIAHQFKQPLSIINLKAQHLEFDYEMDEHITQQNLIKQTSGIQKQISHMIETIDEFRNFFVSKKQKDETCIKKLLDSVLILTKDELIKNNVAITVEGSCAKQLEIYSNEFKHLLLNIINNAKDALVENNIQDKKIACTIQEEPHQTVVIIADNGGGIPQNIIDKVFEPRFTTKAAGKGSGIGLYISRQIAQKIGASIDVENKNGGAVFRISIPHGGNK